MYKSKEELAIKLNLEFDEVVDLFSEETLSSMEQDELLGGANSGFCLNLGYCPATNETNCPVPTPAPNAGSTNCNWCPSINVKGGCSLVNITNCSNCLTTTTTTSPGEIGIWA